MPNRRRDKDDLSTDAPVEDCPMPLENDASEKPSGRGRAGRRRFSRAGRHAPENAAPTDPRTNRDVPFPDADKPTPMTPERFYKEREPVIAEAAGALATAFHNVCKLKEIHGFEEDKLLNYFINIMHETRRGGGPSRGSGGLPDKAPELWGDRDRSTKTSPTQFIRRVYDLWLGNGLKRSHLREFDPQLYQAFANWVSRHPQDDIPELARQHEEVDAMLSELSLLYEPDQLRRLGMALHARQKRNNSI